MTAYDKWKTAGPWDDLEPEPKPELCACCHAEELFTDMDKQTGLCPDCRSSERSAQIAAMRRMETIY